MDITVDNPVSAQLSVHGGPPTGVDKSKGDELILRGGSPKAELYESRSKKPGTGSALVSYPETTHTRTTVDFTDIEKLTLNNERPHGKEDKAAKEAAGKVTPAAAPKP
ncbi:hypothetical protein OG755_37840 [Streptomyces sp. NBC_01443]|nr:hypothetical protein [Streptomyces sp. NBC_01443]MCX4632371.1 hypothetical protein [Streptomyces sp. NBC_01443]